MKYLFFILLPFVLSACSNSYVEPPLKGNDAVLKIKVDKPFEFNAPFGMIIEAELDGKQLRIHKYPNLTARVAPGKHTLSVSVSAYYFNRAKYHSTKTYEVEFKPNDTVFISSKVASRKLQSRNQNVNANLSIKGSGININSQIILQDSAMRSMVCKVPDCIIPIIIIN